jgi:hypothetical protein
MTRATLYDFLTEGLLDGQTIDLTLFGTLLDVAQMLVEDARPWVWLRGEDLTQTVSAGSPLTAKDLAASWRSWPSDAPIQLLDSGYNTVLYLREVPFGDRYKYKNTSVFCVDYPNSDLYILGSHSQNYTIKQEFSKISTLVSAAESNSWVFPERFHKILAYIVSTLWRNGIDYDVFSNPMGDNNASTAAAMLDLMTRWDSNLQAGMQAGQDPYNPVSVGTSGTSGGNVNNLI